MKTLNKFLITTGIVLGSFLFPQNCAKDIVVSPPSSLRGVYEGTYTRVKGYSSGSGQITDDEYIEWTFTDYKFYCDAIKENLKPRFACDCFGNYNTESGIALTHVEIKPQVCDPEDSPKGNFSLSRFESEEGKDSLVLEQLDVSKDIKKIIMLVKEP